MQENKEIIAIENVQSYFIDPAIDCTFTIKFYFGMKLELHNCLRETAIPIEIKWLKTMNKCGKKCRYLLDFLKFEWRHFCLQDHRNKHLQK